MSEAAQEVHTSKGDIIANDDIKQEALPGAHETIRIGDWYWVKDRKEEWFGCVTKVGSNFVELHGVPEGSYQSSSYDRIHFNDFLKVCRLEPDPEAVIMKQVEFHRAIVREKLQEIKDITARLGVTDHLKIGQNGPEEASTKALSVLSGTTDVKDYKKALIKAKEKDLPKLFEEVKEANANMASWMSAQALPMRAMADGTGVCVDEIEGRIFNVSLYAGLSEEVVQVRKGAQAAHGEKLKILQRLLFMDEEALLNYRHGGMEFKHISEFDRWLAKKDNFHRVLPFPRSLVAFRVRREKKDRDWDGSIHQIIVNFNDAELDKVTFLYIRNGERLYRLNCDLEFGELIFPGRDELKLDEPLMAKMFGGSVDTIITKRHYDELVKEWERKVKEQEAWQKKNPGKHGIHGPHGNFVGCDDPAHRHQPFDPSSVYYDDIKEEVANRVKYYNRIALIVQGLFDRSDILHPHPPVRLWTPDGFSAAIELVYDGSDTLNYGTPPDFEAYRQTLNASLEKGSVTVGQDDYWQEREAKKESSRMDRSWRVKSEWRPNRFKPYGNPGPGYLAKIEDWDPKRKKATYCWTRKCLKETWDKRYGDPLSCSIAVPDSRLLNISAYRLGDYKSFYVDPRTRAQYLKWAPMLLAAEDFHAGKLKIGPDEDA